MNQDKPNGHLGIGAFNLIRTSLYKEFGGYEALRLCVVDDIKLGQLVRRAGGRTRAFIGGDDVECHWGVTVPSMIKIMEKNFFAALDYRTIQGIFFGLVLNIFWAACIVGPFTGSIWGFCAAGSLIFSAIPAAIVCKRLRWPLRGVYTICLCGPLLRRAKLDDRNAAPARHSMAGYILSAGDSASREFALGAK